MLQEVNMPSLFSKLSNVNLLMKKPQQMQLERLSTKKRNSRLALVGLFVES